MIYEVTGDILLSSAQAIVHSVAPNDSFHSGLALALREKWPAMYKDFRHYCQTNHPAPGTIWTWEGVGEKGPVRIVALLAQDGSFERGGKPGPANVSYLNRALKALHAWVNAEHIQSLALPKLCTGVGTMAWADSDALIHQHLGALAFPVYVYTTYHKGMQASEPTASSTMKV